MPQSKKRDMGVRLPTLPSGWSWDVTAVGPDAKVTVAGGSVTLTSGRVKPNPVKALALADAVRVAADLARLDVQVATFGKGGAS